MIRLFHLAINTSGEREGAVPPRFNRIAQQFEPHD